MNDRDAKIIVDENIYPDGANSPTRHIEYVCPCGNGRIIDERVVGFHDYYSWIECDVCKKKYKLQTGCGYIWELIKK